MGRPEPDLFTALDNKMELRPQGTGDRKSWMAVVSTTPATSPLVHLPHFIATLTFYLCLFSLLFFCNLALFCKSTATH